MFNLKPPFATATLDKWLGLYTEAPATSLPEGASPLSLNCDYEISDVHQRPGKESAFYFEDLLVERICGFAQTVADGPDELAWTDPTNATLGEMGVYASVALSTPTGGTPGIISVLNPAEVVSGFQGNSLPFNLTGIGPQPPSAFAYYMLALSTWDNGVGVF